MRVMQARWWLLRIASVLFVAQSTSKSSIANETQERKKKQLHDRRFGNWLIAAAGTRRWHVRYIETFHGQPRQKKRPSRTQWETCHCGLREGISRGYGTGKSSPCQVHSSSMDRCVGGTYLYKWNAGETRRKNRWWVRVNPHGPDN